MDVAYWSGQLIPPEVAVIFGSTDLYYRSVAHHEPMRTSIAVRDRLCVENPRIAALSRILSKRVELEQRLPRKLIQLCANAIGVLESFSFVDGWHRLQSEDSAQYAYVMLSLHRLARQFCALRWRIDLMHERNATRHALINRALH